MNIGLYEQIIDLMLQRSVVSLGDRAEVESLDSADSHDFLAQYLFRVLLQGLAQVQPESGLPSIKEKSRSKIARQIDLCNELIGFLSKSGISGLADARISSDAKRLMAVLDDASRKSVTRPDTPLALGALLTGARQDPSLVSQLQKEIVSADQIDILCSFIKWRHPNSS